MGVPPRGASWTVLGRRPLPRSILAKTENAGWQHSEWLAYDLEQANCLLPALISSSVQFPEGGVWIGDNVYKTQCLAHGSRSVSGRNCD